KGNLSREMANACGGSRVAEPLINPGGREGAIQGAERDVAQAVGQGSDPRDRGLLQLRLWRQAHEPSGSLETLGGNLEGAKQKVEDGEASEQVKLKWGVEGLGVASMLAEDAETEREVIRSRVDLRNTPQRNTAVIEQIDKRAFVVHVVGEVKGCAVVLQGTT